MSEAGWEKKYIQEAFDTNWVVPLGPNVDAFEEELKQYVKEDKEIVALSSGTAAVHLLIAALAVRKHRKIPMAFQIRSAKLPASKPSTLPTSAAGIQ